MTTKPVNNTPSLNPAEITPKDNAEKAERLSKLKSSKDAKKTTGTVESTPNYDVNLSPQAKSMAEARKKALDIARSTPAVREDKVADIKKRVDNGTYKVDSGNIADGMLKESVREELAEKEQK